MELRIGAVKPGPALDGARVLLWHEGDVNRRRLALLAEVYKACRQLRPQGRRGRQKARAGRRRERHGALELRVIAPAGAAIGIGPAVIENIFAIAVVLEIAGHNANDAAPVIFKNEMAPAPAGFGDGRL